MQDIVNKFTTHLKNVLTRALCFAVSEGQDRVLPEHLLWALATEQGSIAAEVLHRHKIKLAAVHTLVGTDGKELKERPNPRSQGTPALSDTARRMIERAVYLANAYHHRYVGTEHLLGGILHVTDEHLRGFFASQKINVNALQDQLAMVFQSTSRFPEMEALLAHAAASSVPSTFLAPAILSNQEEEEEEDDGTEADATPALDFFTRDLTSDDIAQTIDPVIGREREIERVMEILCRRTKNNPILTGEPGVGKTAIVEGLAKRIFEEHVPPALAGKRILALDLSSVVAGTTYRGEFEGRIKQIVEETQAHPEIILFIDELHTIIGAGAASGSLDAANMLKPALARGEIRCIGATTPAEYKKHIEPDAALERRFGRVVIEEPSAEASLRILQGVAPYYARYHRVAIHPAALVEAVRLSGRYFPDRFFPDKAIDLLDEAASSVRVAQTQDTTGEGAVRNLEKQLSDLRDEKRQAIVEERFKEAQALKERENIIKEDMKRVKAKQTIELVGEVRVENILSVVSRATGIPVGVLQNEERERLKGLAAALSKTVIGQKTAVEAVAEAILRSKTGVTAQGRPQASFLFVGPSGVGKTALAQALAQELFKDRDALIHLDMSEYAEGYAVSKLIGSPAGYVGYREGAKLTDQVRQKPYAVVLFDEIEKAHPDAQALLLQILETGPLSDATGRAINFRQTIIVMTTNVGLERFGGGALGFDEDASSASSLRVSIQEDLKERFRPELLNRVDRTLVFEPLNTKSLETIAKQGLQEIKARLLERERTLHIEKDVAQFIAKESYDPSAGARAVRRFLQTHVETLLAEKLLAARSPKTLRLKRQGNRLTVTQK